MNIITAFIILMSLIAFGILSRKFKILEENSKKTLSSFIYYFALPSLFFIKIIDINLLEIKYITFLLSSLPIIIILLIFILLKLFKVLNKDRFVILMITISFGSHAFFGVPFFESLFGDNGLEFIILQASFLGIIGIVITILSFEYAVHKDKSIKLLLKIISNPLLISILLGIIISLLKIKFEKINIILAPVQTVLSALGKTAGGIAIFTLGLFIYDNFSLDLIKKAVIYSLVRILLLPIVTIGILLFFNGIERDLKVYILLLSGIPAAISTAVFAQKYEYKIPEITGMVILTSLMSFILLGILYLLSFIYK